MTMRPMYVFGVLLASTAAPAATLSEMASGVEVNGWVSASYLHSFIDEDLTSTRTLAIEPDSLQLDQAVLNLSSKGENGFSGFVSILLGEDAARLVNASYGEGDGDKFGVAEAYLSYASGPWSLRAGRYASLAGYEVWGDALNPTLTRSLQFTAAEPFFLTGVRASYAASDSTTLYLGVVNSAFGGYANDTNEQKTVEAGASFALSDSFSLGIYDYYGVENDLGDVNYLDVVASYAATRKLTLALNGDLYQDDFVDILGIAGYATYQFSDRWSATVRLESLDRDFDDGTQYTINAATVDVAFKPVREFRVLMEARVDDADEDIFLDDRHTGSMTGTQPTIGIKAIYSLGM